jgi:hypothetical protein
MKPMQEQQPAIEQSLTWRMLDGDAVIVSPRNGKIRVLNHSGAYIWQMLAAGRSTTEISRALVERYEVSDVQASLDLQTFLKELTQQGLVLWKPSI